MTLEGAPFVTNLQNGPNDQSYCAAVVHFPIIGVRTDETAPQTMRRNAARVAATIDHIMGIVTTPPRLLVFPVLCLTGARRRYREASLASVATELPGDFLQPILDACKRHSCYFASSAQEKLPQFPGRHFHTGFVLGPDGLVLRSPKAQAFSAPGITPLRELYAEYVEAFGEDAVLPVAATPLGVLGCLVESEVLVPEAARLLRRKGAEIIVHPTQEHSIGDRAYGPMRQAIAYANGVYCLSAGRSLEFIETDAGLICDTIDSTSSTIVGPDGVIEASISGSSEGFVLGRIDLARIRMSRERQARDTTPADVLYQSLYRSPGVG